MSERLWDTGAASARPAVNKAGHRSGVPAENPGPRVLEPAAEDCPRGPSGPGFVQLSVQPLVRIVVDVQ